MHGAFGPVHIATWRSKLAHKHTLAKDADTHRLRCRSADVFWISVLLLLLGEELLGAGSVAYVCAAAAVRFTEEKRHLRG